MERKTLDGIEWLEFELLSDFPLLRHQMFLRQGGCSEGPYAGLNTGLAVGDNETHVRANLQLIQNRLKADNPDWKRYVWGNARHGTDIEKITDRSPEEILGCDGLVTDVRGTTLMMKCADCQIVLFYDPINHAAANVHAGWRGSVANIYEKTVRTMQNAFGSNPADLLVCISPSLGPDESEFVSYRSDFPEEFWDFQIRPNRFDFWSIARFKLSEAGILAHHIEIARLSTFCNPHDFFSYRRDGLTGRHAVCITLY